jgi:hypothetical protein
VYFNTSHREVSFASVVLYWVVQRDAKTGALITFRSFEDYDDAERHKANLEDAPVSNTSTVTIETIPNTRSPR